MADPQPEFYSDNQGQQPEVENDQLPAFARFILGNNEDEDGLDMNGVTGICCGTVHPQIHKVLSEMNETARKLNVPQEAFMTRLQHQIVVCLSGDIAKAFVAQCESGTIVMDEAALRTVIGYAMQNMALIYDAIAPDFDDNPALAIARKMAEWIGETHKDNLPFFWKEVEETLKGYDNIDPDELDAVSQ